MNEPSVNPIWVTLLCAARLLIPILALLGLSYLLKKLGLVTEPPQPGNHNENNNQPANQPGKV